MKVKIEGRGKEEEDVEKCLMLEAEKVWVGRQNFSMVFIVCKVLFTSMMLFDPLNSIL